MCEKCGGSGVIQDDDGSVQECPLCRVSYLRQISGLMEHEWSVNLKGLDPVWGEDTARLRNYAKQVIGRELTWLAILGPSGNGKTHALMAIVNAFTEQGIPARYYTFADLLAYVRQGFGEDARIHAEARIDQLIEVPVLALDEADKFNETGWAQEMVFRLIDRRWRLARAKPGAGRRITVFAMNAEPEEGYLQSRLLDASVGVVTRIYSADVRTTLPPEEPDF